MKYIRFYTKDERGDFAFLSNDYNCELHIGGKIFHSVHQYLAWKKAVLSGDIKLAYKIYCSKTIDELKTYESQLVLASDPYIREIMCTEEFRAVYNKFKSNEDILNKFLTLSVDTVFALCNRHDFISGIGLDYNDKRRDNMRFWRGDNVSGKILSSVRHFIEEVG